jgi:kynurenine formamidase
LPNDADKVSRKTFHTNPPYLAQEAALFLRESGIQHLLIDYLSIRKRMKGNHIGAQSLWNVTDVKI